MNRNVYRVAAVVVILLSAFFGVGRYLNSRRQLQTPAGWSADMELNQNKLGEYTVMDAIANQFLFRYSPAQKFRPVAIEKKDDHTWTVTFKRKPETNAPAESR